MTFRGLAAGATLGLAFVLTACGGGSGRSGTDLAVTGVGPSVQLNGGDAAAFVMTVTNQGDYEASNVSIKNATLQLSQSSLTITCTAGGGAACPAQMGASMNVPSLPSGGSLKFSINTTVNVGASGTISDTMTVNADSVDTNSGNNVFAVTATAVSNDVGVTGTPPAGPLVDGPATFIMVVSNAGPDDALNVVLTTSVSADLTLVPGTVACTPSGGAVAPTLQADGTLLSTLIPANGVLTCSVPVTVAIATNGFAIVTMATSTLGDSRSSNNSATASVSATLVSDLNVTAGAPAPSVVGGGTTTFTMVVANAGPATALDVALTNALSANLTLAGPIGCVASGGAVAPVATADGGLKSPSIPLGGLLTCSVPVTVAAGAGGIVYSTFTASTAGDQRTGDNSATASTVAVSSNLGVSQSAAAQVAAGSSVVFTALVNNPGPGTASNLQITWTHSSSPDVSFDMPTCTATGGGTCPSTLGSTMTLPSLGVGRTLVFTFSASTAATFRGAIVNTVTVASDEDQDLSNNTASTTVIAVDARNGAYSAFAADGKPYDLSIDFDAGQYTMSGNGQSVQRNFVWDGASGDYVVSGNARLRVAQDLLVGGHDFGSGVLPFVAARSFTTSLNGIAGSYDLATRILPVAGPPITRPATALISGNTLSICESETLQVTAVRTCSATARKDYLGLGLSGNVFTGTTSTGEAYSFVVANSGAAKIVLSAGPAPLPDTGQQMRIGLIDSTAGFTFGPQLRGPSTTGDWVTIALGNTSPPTYAASGSFTSDTANLVTINSGGAGPFSMLTGTSATYNSNIYVMQAYPLVVVVGGASGFGGAASGLLQVAVP